MPEQFYSPKQVADAFGVSESSLKRWCDRGLIPVRRTAGKHRRLAVPDVLLFCRQSGHSLQRPELLGLPVGTRPLGILQGQQELYAALRDGDESGCRRVILGLFLNNHPLSDLGDQVLSPTMKLVGEQWQCGELDIYQERRSCEQVERCLQEVRLILAPPGDASPLAIGGAPSGDPYRLPTLLVELTLRGLGWQAESLGVDLPFSTLAKALNQLSPRLFWLSVSSIRDREEFLAEYAEFYAAAVAAEVPVVVGGAALTEELRQHMCYGAYCDRLCHLVSFVATLGSDSVRNPGVYPRKFPLSPSSVSAGFQITDPSDHNLSDPVQDHPAQDNPAQDNPAQEKTAQDDTA